MIYNYKVANGKPRALVCYCETSDGAQMRDTIKAVFAARNIDIEPFIDDGSETVWTIAHVIRFLFDTPKSALNIALKYADKIKRLKVGGSFNDVCVGVFFYDAPEPIDTRGTMAEVNEFFGEEIEPELPSLTELVCDALKDAFGGVYGASEFVIPKGETSYALVIEYGTNHGD